MKSSKDKKFGALVPVGKRIDHPENARQRKKRELGAAFNRMGSDSDAEAHNAFDKAREIMRDIGTSFDAILKASRETNSLQDINSDLGKQLKKVMQENARYRAMNISYKIKGQLVLTGRTALRIGLLTAPLIVTLFLFHTGLVSAGGAALLLLPIGLYNAGRGMFDGHAGRALFGTLIILASLISGSVVADRDAPLVHRQKMALIENMNRDLDFGPRTLTIDYPISHSTLITTVIGTRDVLKITVEGAAAPLEITCSKYYENPVIVRESEREITRPPPSPDIFHVDPVATFGACDMYAKLSAMH
jgi:hypothetical protein